jgi:hypothetical protein
MDKSVTEEEARNERCNEYVYKELVDADLKIDCQPTIKVKRVIRKEPWATRRIPALMRELQKHVDNLSDIGMTRISGIDRCTRVTTDNPHYMKPIVDRSKLVCWYDCCPFEPDQKVLPYPIERTVDTRTNTVQFGCIGYFCSWSCMCSYRDEMRPECRRNAETQLIVELMYILDGVMWRQAKCLMPKECIDVFGGTYGVKEWRQINAANLAANMAGQLVQVQLRQNQSPIVVDESQVGRWFANNMQSISAHLSTYPQTALLDAEVRHIQQLWNKGQVQSLAALKKRVSRPTVVKDQQSKITPKTNMVVANGVVSVPFRIV